jgi:hypothetical protein
LFGVTKTTTTFCSVIEAVKLNKIKLFLPGRISTDATSASSTNSLKLSVRDAMIPGIGVEKDITIATTGAKGRYFEYRPRGFAAEWYNYDAVTTFATDVPIFVVAPSIGTTAFVEIDVGVQFTVASSVAAAAALFRRPRLTRLQLELSASLISTLWLMRLLRVVKFLLRFTATPSQLICPNRFLSFLLRPDLLRGFYRALPGPSTCFDARPMAGLMEG